MGDKELAKVLQQAEKITLKLLVDGEEIGEIDMGVPKQGCIYKEEIGWFMFGRFLKVPCEPYEMKMGGGMVDYYYPYHMTLGITRNMTKEEREAMRRQEEQVESLEENPEMAVPNDF